MTIEYALETLGIEVTEDRLVVDGEEFRNEDPNVTVSVTVNGEEVDPQEYVLKGVGPIDDAKQGEGDNVRITVKSE